jgi:GPH family glycoside/pentoside/hexuronide:cation symporter
MALPLLASVILTFFVPENWNHAAKTVYICLTYFLMITVAITPASLVGMVLGTNISVNSKSRQKFSVISTVFTMAGSVVGNVVVLQITQAMRDSYESWRLVAVIFGCLAFAGQLAQYLLTRERQGSAPKNTGKLSESLPALIKNKYFIIMCFAALFIAVDGAMAGSIMYFAKYVLNRVDLLGVISGIMLLATMAGIGLTPILAKKIPAKRLILAGLAIKAATLFLNLLQPGSIVLFIGLGALRSIAGAPMMIYSSVYLLNTIEYGEYTTGIRANHLIVSVSSVWSKVGSGLGGALIGWMLSFGGYDGTAAVQGASALAAITNVYFLIPLVTSVVLLALMSMYNLDEKYAGIATELRKSREIAVANG